MDSNELILSRRQRECVEFCLDTSRRLVAVTGQAGTGKTTLIRYIHSKLSGEIAVAAPTGKAAKRIHEATGLHAVTLHKLLEYGRPKERDVKTGKPLDPTVPRRGRDHPLSASTVFVDEYSMVSHELNRNLIDALPRGRGRLIMFGDVSQLSPIEPYPYTNIKDSPFVEHLKVPGRAFELNEIYRQGEHSGLLAAAYSIRQGRMPRQSDDFKIQMTQEPVKKLRELVRKLTADGIDFSKLNNQILTPVKSRWIGTAPLNVMLRNIYNPHGRDAVSLLRHEWDEKRPVTVSVGDKVVCTENTYDMRDYSDRYERFDSDGKPLSDSFIDAPDTKYMLNGEVGIVLEIYPDTSMEIDLGDRIVEVPYQFEEYSMRFERFYLVFPQRSIELAYAMTTHKAQGSEYDTVIYVINTSTGFMLSRENLYTAVTRAKKSAWIITDASSLTTSLRITREVINKRQLARVKNARSMITDETRSQYKKG